MSFGIFTELSLILVLATVVAAIMRLLRQPLIIGHILSGLIAGPLLFNVIHSKETLEVFSELGIALLLFMVGISLSPRVIKEVGSASLIIGLGQIFFTVLLGFAFSRLLGIAVITSLYLGLALTFSSTIIILKLLSDKRDLEKLYGKMSMGLLIIQDIVVALILIVISSFNGSSAGLVDIFADTVVKGAFLAAFLILVGVAVLPRLSNFFARSQELLFIFAIAWGLGLASLFGALGFSIEIGALVAGVALSTSPYSVEVAARLRPLRDFFIFLFFILLGTQIVFSSLAGLVGAILLLSAFVLIIKPLIVMLLMRALGYGKRVGFLTGLTVTQISEFSLILVLLGARLGHVGPELLSLVTVVGLITIAGSTYLILYAEKIYGRLAPYLDWLERRTARPNQEFEEAKYDIILFGLNRIGYDFMKIFKQLKGRVLVVDFNPEVVKDLMAQGLEAIYGDADDTEFLDTIPLESAKLCISTIPEFETNTVLVTRIRKVNKQAVVIVLNHVISETLALYKTGASYVVLPHFLGGQYAAELVSKFGFMMSRYNRESRAHIKDLERRVKRGHQHPAAEYQR